MSQIVLEGIDLSRWLHWANEFNRSGIGQSSRFAADGSRYLTENPRRGQPIILHSNPGVTVPRVAVQALYALHEISGAIYSLSLDGVAFSVQFWRDGGGGLVAEGDDPDLPDVYYTLTLQFVEI